MLSVLKFVYDMLPYMLFACPALLLWRLAAVKLRFPKKGIRTTARHEVGTLLLALFLVGVASQTIFFKLNFTDATVYLTGLSTGEMKVNLIPFRVIYENYKAIFVDGMLLARAINSLGNIVIFLPIGFFIPLLYRGVSLRRTALIALCISLSIELIQIPLDRWTDIDDLWLNTLGAFLGCLLYRKMQKHFPAVTDKYKVSPSTSAPTP